MSPALIFAAGVAVGELATLAALALCRAAGDADDGFGLDPALPPDFHLAQRVARGRAGPLSPDQADGPAQLTPFHARGVNDA